MPDRAIPTIRVFMNRTTCGRRYPIPDSFMACTKRLPRQNGHDRGLLRSKQHLMKSRKREKPTMNIISHRYSACCAWPRE